METVAEVSLAFNRCVEIFSPRLSEILFKGYRTWIWMAFPTLYGLYWSVYTEPILFSGLYLSWFFNPHVGYFDDFGMIYHNDIHTVHNYFVIFGLTSTYFFFGLVLAIKTYKYKAVTAGGSTQNNYSQKMVRLWKLTFFMEPPQIFLQVVMISMINAVAASVYVYMQFNRITEFIIILGQLTWVLAHGTFLGICWSC